MRAAAAGPGLDAWTLFAITVDTSPFWPRLAGGLLILISTFYVPMTFDFDRYRVFAWLAVFPSRTFGATFFVHRGASSSDSRPASWFRP